MKQDEIVFVPSRPSIDGRSIGFRVRSVCTDASTDAVPCRAAAIPASDISSLVRSFDGRTDACVRACVRDGIESVAID